MIMIFMIDLLGTYLVLSYPLINILSQFDNSFFMYDHNWSWPLGVAVSLPERTDRKITKTIKKDAAKIMCIVPQKHLRLQVTTRA